MKSLVRDEKLAGEGLKELEWAEENMPLLREIKKRFEKEKPLRGLVIGTCLHLEKKTGILLRTLKAGGARIAATSCNPLTTDDRVAAALAREMSVFAWAGETDREYYANIKRVLDEKPNIVIDDGCDQIFALHTKRRNLLPNIIGGCEETTTGVTRLRAMERDRKLEFPVVAVNNAYSKYLFDNRFGTGQSTVDALMRVTNKLIAGKTVVVAGFGSCGRGIADRLGGMGANVIITETAERLGEGPSGLHKALEALYSGFRVIDMARAAGEGDIFITATGGKNILTRAHFDKMKDGALLANAGHFNVEIDIPALEKISKKRETVKENLERFTLKNGKKIFLISEGRLLNLARPSGQGHPIEIMDGSFAIQALCAEHLAKNRGKLRAGVHDVPQNIDDEVAGMALLSQGIKLDKLTEEQKKYARSWEEGT
ncbi:MAG: adenosylhomocysteinase [Candidatus Micrarchaeota archaeon]